MGLVRGACCWVVECEKKKSGVFGITEVKEENRSHREQDSDEAEL
jgi:hypothetical protein